MAEQEIILIEKLESLTGETDIPVLSAYLEMAGEVILNKMFPFGEREIVEVPSKYVQTQLEIAVYLLNKRGAEGEIRHDENGIDRSYESASVPESMLKRVTPYVKFL